MRTFIHTLGAVTVALSALLVTSKDFAADDAATRDDVTVLARGPIHEAFAQPTNRAPEAGPIIPKAPPAPIPEEPPDQKVKGDNVQWIPGYWAWDEDRSDYLWVSGTWRVPPPDRKWMPGHWTEVDRGWQWAPGFWASDRQENLTYQEQPPASLDEGPSSPAPDENSLYIPGSWVYRGQRYLWQAGYWTNARPGYVWTPPNYCYTPSGYVSVDGYWDYPVEDRGCLFAPVYFNRPLWRDRDWSYQPSYCVNPQGLLGSLFVRPGCGNYYFGDYYGRDYRRLGYSPWFSYGQRYGDPLFNHSRWANRDNPGWYAGLRDTYRGRLDGSIPRPARTLAGQNALLANGSRNGIVGRNRNELNLVGPLSQVNNIDRTRLSRNQIAAYRSDAQNIQRQATNRQGQERPGRTRIGTGGSLPSGGRSTLRTVQGNPIQAGRPITSGRLGNTPPSRSVASAPRPKIGTGGGLQMRPGGNVTRTSPVTTVNRGGSGNRDVGRNPASRVANPTRQPTYRAPVRSAPVRSAPRPQPAPRAQPAYRAPVRSAPVRSAPVRSTPAPRAQPTYRAPARSTPAPRAQPTYRAPARSAPARSAPARSGGRKR